MTMTSRIRRVTVAVLGLLAVAGWLIFLFPASLGGSTMYVIVSGSSMEPTLETGHLVLLHEQSSYTNGDVVSYHVPEGEPGAGSTVIHRIVGGDAGGGYILRGDNRDSDDLWRPKPDTIDGRQWLAIPYAGQVLAFLRSVVGLALVGGLLTCWLVARALDDEEGDRVDGASEATEGSRPKDPEPATQSKGLGRLALVLVVAGLVLSHSEGSAVSSAAALPTTAKKLEVYRPSNLPCSNPGSTTVPANADTWNDQAAQGVNHGTETSLSVMSKSTNANRRALVRFTLPTLPANCSVTSATLQLYNATPTTGRTIDVYRANAAWTETTLTWNTPQPGTTGTAVGSATTATVGYQQWTVTAHVQAMYTTNNGFVIRDRTENTATGPQQIYTSSQATSNQPQLIVTRG